MKMPVEAVKKSWRAVLILLVSVLLVVLILLMGSRKATAEVSQKKVYEYYTSVYVEEGDTLTSIAREYHNPAYGPSVKEMIKRIKTVNHLGSDKIYAGRYLMVPYYSEEEVF